MATNEQRAARAKADAGAPISEELANLIGHGGPTREWSVEEIRLLIREGMAEPAPEVKRCISAWHENATSGGWAEWEKCPTCREILPTLLNKVEEVTILERLDARSTT